MMRYIRLAWRWLAGRRFVVSYDPDDVQWYMDWHNEKPPIYTDTLAQEFGANEYGEFRSKRKAMRFLKYLRSRHGYEYPILPTHITKVGR